MLIRFFKSAQPATLFILPFMALGCWFLAYISLSPDISHDSMPLARYFMDWTSGWSGLSRTILAFLIFGFQALYLNYVVNNHELLYKQTNLTGFWYIILMTMVPAGMHLQPVLIANTLFIVLLNKMFNLYKLDEPTGTIFDSTFLIAVATLFFLPSIIFLPVFFIALSMLRPFSAREWVVGITGFLLPFFFFWSGSYLLDQPDILARSVIDSLKYYDLGLTLPEKPEVIAVFGLLALILGFALLKFQANLFKNVIRTRKYQRILFIMLVASIVGVIWGNPWTGAEFQLIVMPVSILFAYYFMATKRAWWTEGLTLLLIGAIVFRYLSELGMVQ